MAYLGDVDRPSTYRVGCDGCAKTVKGAEPPKTWLLLDEIPMRHFCPKCKAGREIVPAARQRKERRR